MAGDARISTALPSHPKTKKLIRRHGDGAAWRLICLFLWVAENRSDGNLAGMSVEDIELASDWQGDEGAFVAALSDVGFLDGEEGGYSVHDWAEHNPWAAGAHDRSEASKWAALCKRYGRAGAAERMPEYAERMRTPPEPQESGSDPDAELCDPHAAGTNPQCPVSVSVSVSDTDTALVDSKPPTDVETVFDHWRQVMDSPRSILDRKRAGLIRQALKLGYTVDDLRAAINGCRMTPHNMGVNERGTRFNGLDLILRNADNIDRFMGTARAGGPRVVPFAQQASQPEPRRRLQEL